MAPPAEENPDLMVANDVAAVGEERELLKECAVFTNNPGNILAIVYKGPAVCKGPAVKKSHFPSSRSKYNPKCLKVKVRTGAGGRGNLPLATV